MHMCGQNKPRHICSAKKRLKVSSPYLKCCEIWGCRFKNSSPIFFERFVAESV